MARMNISVPDELYERYQRVQERLNASRVCAEALEREIDMMEGVGTGEVAVEAMVERLMNTKERSYSWGYADGRAWGLEKASRSDLETARELKEYSGRELLTESVPNPNAGRGHDEPDWVFPAGVPEQDIPGLGEGSYGGRMNTALAALDQHLAKDEEGDVEAYAEGWRDALADLYGVLQKAERTPRTRVPHVFRQALESQGTARAYRPFEEARAYVQTLGLKDQAEWNEWARRGQKPADIPASPMQVYKEWAGWADWMGLTR